MTDGVRLDRWLCAARFFKSRTLASKACDGGKVDVNGNRSKSHKAVREGDVVEFYTGRWKRIVKVLKLSEKRGPARIAQTLYEDMSPPEPEKEDVVFLPLRDKGAGRPTKRERRKLRELKKR